MVATAGDQRVELSWNAEVGADYWAFASTDPTLSLNNWTTQPNAKVVRNIRSPGAVTGLTNGITYYFIVNGRNRAGAGGDASLVMSATPRSAGDVWTAGTLTGSGNLRAVAANDTRLAVAGAGGSLFTSTDASTWSAVVSGSTKNFNAATFGGGYFVLAGNAGAITRSSDGITWTVQNANLTADLLDVSGSVKRDGRRRNEAAAQIVEDLPLVKSGQRVRFRGPAGRGHAPLQPIDDLPVAANPPVLPMPPRDVTAGENIQQLDIRCQTDAHMAALEQIMTEQMRLGKSFRKQTMKSP